MYQAILTHVFCLNAYHSEVCWSLVAQKLIFVVKMRSLLSGAKFWNFGADFRLSGPMDVSLAKGPRCVGGRRGGRTFRNGPKFAQNGPKKAQTGRKGPQIHGPNPEPSGVICSNPKTQTSPNLTKPHKPQLNLTPQRKGGRAF